MGCAAWNCCYYQRLQFNYTVIFCLGVQADLFFFSLVLVYLFRLDVYRSHVYLPAYLCVSLFPWVLALLPFTPVHVCCHVERTYIRVKIKIFPCLLGDPSNSPDQVLMVTLTSSKYPSTHCKCGMTLTRFLTLFVKGSIKNRYEANEWCFLVRRGVMTMFYFYKIATGGNHIVKKDKPS